MPFSCCLKISHRHISKHFSPPNNCTRNSFFTSTICSFSRADSWILAAKLPNSNFNFPSPGICSEKFLSDFCRGLLLTVFGREEPQEEVSGTDIPMTSAGHSGRCSGTELQGLTSKNSHVGADIHDSNVWTSMKTHENKGFTRVVASKCSG